MAHRWLTNVIGLGVCSLVLAACAIPHFPTARPALTPSDVKTPPATAVCSTSSRCLGVAVRNAADVPAFAAETGTRPAIVTLRLPFGQPFPVAQASAVGATGALPLLQLLPEHTLVGVIATGGTDSYLLRLGAAIRAYGHPVALSFAPDPGSRAYPWGCGRALPAAYVQAWRHAHDVIAAAGARPTWVWQASWPVRGACPAGEWFPGRSYVAWAGLDARLSSGSWARTAGPAVARLRSLTGRPVLVTAGVAVGPAQAGSVSSLLAGAAKAPGVVGLVYLDYLARTANYQPAARALRRSGRPRGRSGSPKVRGDRGQLANQTQIRPAVQAALTTSKTLMRIVQPQSLQALLNADHLPRMGTRWHIPTVIRHP
jgi:hypothetical protein